MAAGLQRTSFNSSRLTRLLSELSVGEPAAGNPPRLADRLGSWLDWTDSIALAAAQGQPVGGAHLAPRGVEGVSRTALEELRRVRAALSASISDLDGLDEALDVEWRAGGAAATAAPTETDLAPYRRQHAALQRAMDAAIAPLRAGVRATLQRTSPALARLAAMDAVLDAALQTRERHLLGKVPALMEVHFARLRDGQPSTATDWRAAVRHSLREALQAELDLRLQPVEGLLEALSATARARP
jgi:Protein of unknown function (DUF3348)